MRLNLQSYGTGFPLIILHGLFGSLDNWQTISRKLAEHFQIFAIDQRNHGGSPHSDDFNYQVMAEDLFEVMESNGLTKAHLLGHSMGGKTAMQFALSYPGKVEKLIVADIAPKAYPPWHIPIFEALLSLELTQYRSRKQIDDALAVSIPETALRQFLLKNLATNPDGTYRWKIDLQSIYRNYSRLNAPVSGVGTFTGPVLFIKGEQSDYILDSDANLIRHCFPKAQFRTIPNAAHWLHAEKPIEFIKIVEEFLL
ncbi:alpha/beta hydrolase fold protein [Pedosphaera parvula Ellin514]|uniref:Alpha/beta hydrolase fold protein n=2 Tax=Pedosphaera TaxID=1032526 RepID=B9XE18_PEDPL|nr:alpha/beta hydrolase fold protein [Pedosphaera parvula Ellin514]